VDDDFSQAEMMRGRPDESWGTRGWGRLLGVFLLLTLCTVLPTVHEWGSVQMYTCSNTALGRKRKNRWFCFFIF
jgi:hypothetical protein